MKLSTRVRHLILAAPLLVGCSASAPVVPIDAAMVASAMDLAMPANPGDAAMASGGLMLSGAWASRVVNSQMFSGTLGTDNVVITTLSRQTLVQTGTTVMTTTQVCSVALTPYKGNQTTYPAAAVAAIAPSTGMAILSSDAPGATYTPAQRVDLIAWTSTMPATDALPTMASDPRVVDADGDGHPGITLHVAGLISGDIYVVNRSILDVAGTADSSDHISGTSMTTQAQSVLGATNPLLGASNISSTPDATAGKSTYQAVRVQAGSDSCDQIVAAAATLFP